MMELPLPEKYGGAGANTISFAFSNEAALAKYNASEMAREVTDKAIQIHIGYGYMK